MFISVNFALSFISGCVGLIFSHHFSSMLASVGVGALVQILQRARELTILFYKFVDLALLIFDDGKQFICRGVNLLDVLLVCRGCNCHLVNVDREVLFRSLCEFIAYFGGALSKSMLAW